MSEVPDAPRPRHSRKTLGAVKALRAVKRIIFDKSEASPGQTLHVHMPKRNKNEVFVPGSLVLRFDIDISGRHANNFLVQNVTQALVSKMVVKFAGTILQDLFLSLEQRDNRLLEGIQSEDLCKIRSNAGGTRKPR